MSYKDPVVYNTEASVGWGQPNRLTDVMLVQFFLRDLLNHPDFTASRPPGQDMNVDGIFGPQTETWIQAFQNDVKRHGLYIVVDGRVDPAPHDWQSHTRGGMRYTIMHLNGAFRKRFPTDHDYLDKCARAPGPLRAALQDFLVH